MQEINLKYDGVEDLVITVNGTPIWASNTATREATEGLNVAPLPGSSGADPDLTTALDELAKQHGVVAVQHMIRTIRHNDSGPVESEWLARKAAEDIAGYMKTRQGVQYDEARRVIGTRWGYSGTSMTNFYKIADRGWMATQSGGEAA